jgi:hypothetical protein
MTDITYFNDADIPAMLMACGAVPVVIDDQDPPGIGVVDYVDEAQALDAGIGGVKGQIITALVQTSVYPDLRQSNDPAKASTILFNGTTFRVRRAFKEGDGAVTRIWCARS